MARKQSHQTHHGSANRPRFWGRHAVIAALANPDRTVTKLWGTHEALGALALPPALPVVYADVADLGRMVPSDAPHQGLVAEVEPLGDVWLGDLLDAGREDVRPLVVLDQVTDPHNVGAVLRSAAAFDALGIVTQDRHAPSEGGALARAASGALELVPWVRVVRRCRRRSPLVKSHSYSVPRARDCAKTSRRTAMRWRVCRFQRRSKA